MRKAMFIVLTLCSAKVLAAPNDFVTRLSRARTSAEVQRIRAQHDDLQVANRACRRQMQRQEAPVACYDSLDLEKSWGRHPDPAGRRRIIARLDDLCAEAAENLRVPAKVPVNVSKKCRRDLQNAIDIQTYRRRPAEWSEN